MEVEVGGLRCAYVGPGQRQRVTLLPRPVESASLVSFAVTRPWLQSIGVTPRRGGEPAGGEWTLQAPAEDAREGPPAILVVGPVVPWALRLHDRSIRVRPAGHFGHGRPAAARGVGLRGGADRGRCCGAAATTLLLKSSVPEGAGVRGVPLRTRDLAHVLRPGRPEGRPGPEPQGGRHVGPALSDHAPLPTSIHPFIPPPTRRCRFPGGATGLNGKDGRLSGPSTFTFTLPTATLRVQDSWPAWTTRRCRSPRSVGRRGRQHGHGQSGTFRLALAQSPGHPDVAVDAG